LQDLADYASKNLEAMNPPLFLRFLNLLMNDAIFLLDEAIQVKKKKKELTAPIPLNHHQYTLLTFKM
jgi:ubiquitin conjugation factor E4 A